MAIVMNVACQIKSNITAINYFINFCFSALRDIFPDFKMPLRQLATILAKIKNQIEL